MRGTEIEQVKEVARVYSIRPLPVIFFVRDSYSSLLFAEVAICPNNNEIQVHKRNSSGWKLLETLQEHHMAVMGIDWAPKTNRIVTCSADKNAYVWTQKEDGKWDPAWVLLRINRAATCVKWSPLGTDAEIQTFGNYSRTTAKRCASSCRK